MSDDIFTTLNYAGSIQKCTVIGRNSQILIGGASGIVIIGDDITVYKDRFTPESTLKIGESLFIGDRVDGKPFDLKDLLLQIAEDRKVDYKVEYLDRHDIEKLGWERDPSNDRAEHMAFSKGEVELLWCKTNHEVVIFQEKCKAIKMSSPVVFHGIVKNYSELKQIMNQVL